MELNELQRSLDELFIDLVNQFAKNKLKSAFAVTSFKKINEELIYCKNRRVSPDQLLFLEIMANVSATDVRGPEPLHINIECEKRGRDEDFIEILTENINEQFLWVLVQSFEATERFLKKLNSITDDFGQNPSKNEDALISKERQPAEHFNSKQHIDTQEKNKVQDVIYSLRKKFSKFKNTERKHENLLLWFYIVAFFRNLIVHSEAQICKHHLLRKLNGKMKPIGYHFYFRRSMKKQTMAYFGSIISHFQLKDDVYSLCLLDKTRLKNPYVGLERPLNCLIEHLLSYAALAYAEATTHLGNQPVWERIKKEP